MIIYVVIFITLVAALIASFSQILFKNSMDRELLGIREILRLIYKKRILLGLAGYAVSLVIYLYALKTAPLSVIYPTFASSFIFIALLSHFFLKEKITVSRLVGVLLVFIGIAIIGFTA
ncbi:MAG: EamA family transporter [Candidatus Micrarchaeaceae archaeon]